MKIYQSIIIIFAFCSYSTIGYAQKLSTSKKDELSKLQNKNSAVKNGNPIVANFGMADPHIYIFNNKPYLYTTRDRDSFAKSKFIMPDWHIWTSDDMVNWKLGRTILPTETYMGESTNCWATETATRNGKYYFYFSDKNLTTGVMVSEHPTGPFKDVLGKPMLDTNLTTSKEYDPSVLTDDDANKTPYIIFGHHRDSDTTLGYYISQLNEDMISLAEKPRKIKFLGSIKVLEGNDKPTLHKHKGLYYLSAGSHYAVSKNIYGPYTKWGNSGDDKYGLTAQAHGNYFAWNNQWFHTWCKFHLGKSVAYYRESYLTYMHYKKDGTMVDDTILLSKHFANGIGQYNAGWDRIEAEWYISGDKIEKGENGTGFEIEKCMNNGYLYYPNVHDLKKNTYISFNLKSKKGGKIEVRENSATGKIIGELKVTNNSKNYRCRLKNKEGKKNLYLVFKGEEGENLFSIDSFSFQ
jgi:arabinoxylan arabinofuranohydrolase